MRILRGFLRFFFSEIRKSCKIHGFFIKKSYFFIMDIFNTLDTFLLVDNHSSNDVGLIVLTFMEYM